MSDTCRILNLKKGKRHTKFEPTLFKGKTTKYIVRINETVINEKNQYNKGFNMQRLFITIF